MLLRSTLTALVLLFLAFPSPSRAEPSAAARLQQVLDELDVMEAMLAGKVSEPTRRELLRKVVDVRGRLDSVQRDLLRDNVALAIEAPGATLSVILDVDRDITPEVVEVVEVAQPEPLPMAAGPFKALIAAIEEESFADGKSAVLETAAETNQFTVAQVRQLLPLFTFSDGRIGAAVTLYPRTIDVENWFQVYGEFTFDSDKDELRERLGL
ncbi:DUF4476 domain-containing protein [bacterium]|nr:DUF4476 domain-containing protein [bacterium]